MPTIAPSFIQRGEQKIGKAIQAACRADPRGRRGDACALRQHQLLYVGWQPGATLSLTGYVAMTVGLVAAILLGIGILLLIHRDKRDR